MFFVDSRDFLDEYTFEDHYSVGNWNFVKGERERDSKQIDVFG